MAYAKKRGKTWYVRWQLPDRYANGRHKEGYEDGFATKTAALRYGEDQEAAIRSGTWIDPKSGERTLADWWAEWFPAQGYRAKTRESYEQQWRKHIAPRWGSAPLASIRPIDMDKWINSLRERYASSTVAVIAAPLGDALEDAAINRMIDRSPMPAKDRRGRAAQSPKPKREGVVAPLDHIEAIALRLSGDEALMILVALFTGLRWSEFAAMRLQYLVLEPADSDSPARGYYVVDPVDGAVHEERSSRRRTGAPKSGASGSLGPGYPPGRIIDLPPFLVALLTAYLAVLPAGQDIMFPPLRDRGPDRGFRNYDSFRGRWRRACDGRPAEVLDDGRVLEAIAPIHPGLNIHDLKHTHKALLNNGRIHEAAQDYRLGHATPGAPGVYSHPTPEMRREMVEWLDEVWQAWHPIALIEALEAYLTARGAPPKASSTRRLLAEPPVLPPAVDTLFRFRRSPHARAEVPRSNMHKRDYA